MREPRKPSNRRRSPRILATLLRPFEEQSFRVTSIVAVGCDAPGVSAIHLPEAAADGRAAHTFDSIARHVRASSNGSVRDHLLLVSARALDDLLSLEGEVHFRAVAIVPASAADPLVWRLQRALFDRGLVGVGSVTTPEGDVHCFLASDAVRSVHHLGAGSRGQVTMSCLGRNGRFANQIFQYAYISLYALRHGATAAVPRWEGGPLFDLHDPDCAGLDLRALDFLGFSDDDRELWDLPDPPLDIDLRGYFQEIPACWRRHRQLLRQMFQLSDARQRALDAWRDEVTERGRRTLVAVHIRRGDYRILQGKDTPWFRLVPEEWYVSWLRAIWPTLRDPLLFVATDEPETVLPAFDEFERVSPALEPAVPALPDHVRDFEILARADYLAICNSSYSRMAAILAPPAQRCFLPSFQTETVEPYEPWVDPAFWARFADAHRVARTDDLRLPARDPAADTEGVVERSTAPAIYFDVSDLLRYLEHHTTLSGIQRVQCEIMRHLVDPVRSEPIHLVALGDGGDLVVIDTSVMLEIVDRLRSGVVSRADMSRTIGALRVRAVPRFVRPRDLFLTVGAFWGTGDAGLLMQALKNRGVTVGVFIHDIISVTEPEFFDIRDTRVFLEGLVEALTFADFILTTSEYNRTALLAHITARDLRPMPVRVVKLAHQLPQAASEGAVISDVVARLLDTEYVLCVGTIEVRKNPSYLFNIWRLMTRGGRSHIPTLVFVGRNGWLVRDFMEQLKACNYLDGRIVVLHDVTDAELDLLYRNCLLTIFPSFAEGWGLPVGESLAHGKVSLASHAGGIPEVGGDLVDAVNPYNPLEGLDHLLRYLDAPQLRRSREDEIARRFTPRRWDTVADEFLESAIQLAGDTPRFDGVAAVTLPSGRYLPLSSDTGAIELDALEGELSAGLSCVSGWRRAGVHGVWAAGPATLLRFRARAATGTRIHIVLRLIAPVTGSCDIRMVSGSGSEILATLAGNADRMAVLACEVEPDNFVTVRLSLAGASSAESGDRQSDWGLRGFLYFEPGVGTGEPARRLPRDRHEPSSRDARVRLVAAPAPRERYRATSLDAFRQSTDIFLPSRHAARRRAPLFADPADKALFRKAVGRGFTAVTDHLTLVRRTNQFVSMSRLSEGSVFDRSGVTRALGYLQGCPPTPWLLRDADGIAVHEDSLRAAPRHDRSYIVFFNGNLHNYYHWMTEAIVPLDILTQSLGRNQDLHIALPTSMDINAMFDHRSSLEAVGLDQYPVEEVSANLIHVKEAIWAESDLVQTMPAIYLQAFRQRIAARYAGSRGARNRRLLIARKGHTRGIRNLTQVEAFLGKKGFETVHLEGMPIVDQIRLFQSAEFVVATHGAGLANLLFCEPGTKVIEFMPSCELRSFFWLISEKLQLVHGMQFCAPAAGQGFQANLHVEMRKLRALYRLVDEATSDSTHRRRATRSGRS